MSPEVAKLQHIFFPRAAPALKQLRDESGEDMKFAYYTTAATASSIIKNKTIWMRNTMTMNDAYRDGSRWSGNRNSRRQYEGTLKTIKSLEDHFKVKMD